MNNDGTRPQYICACCIQTFIAVATVQADFGHERSRVSRKKAHTCTDVVRNAIFTQAEPYKPGLVFRCCKKQPDVAERKGNETDDSDEGIGGGNNNNSCKVVKLLSRLLDANGYLNVKENGLQILKDRRTRIFLLMEKTERNSLCEPGGRQH